MLRVWQWLVAALVAVAFSSCDGGGGVMPSSGGRLYEVLLVGDKDGIVDSVLTLDTPGLPQGEPLFDVSTIDSSSFDQSVSNARSIVMVCIDPQRFSTVRLRYEKDVWAKPQLVVRINAPSAKMLRDSINGIAPKLLRLLNRSELNKSIAMLRQKRNVKAEKMLREMFGIDMWVPMDMTSSKRGDGFLWLSNNSATTMGNIVVYYAPKPPEGSDQTAAFCHSRDSVLGANIKGESDSMRMCTVGATVSATMAFRSGGDQKRWQSGEQVDGATLWHRGLWEMTGDDMGGPFVSGTLMVNAPMNKQLSGRQLVVEGFVFAPGKKKRNAVRQLEAVIYTVKTLKTK